MTVGNLTDEDVARLVRAGRYCIIDGKPCLVVPKPIKWEDYMRMEKLEKYLNSNRSQSHPSLVGESRNDK